MKNIAKLPESLIARPEPTLKDVKVGETIFLKRSAMSVTKELSCFLDPAATFEIEKTPFTSLSVARLEDGFHVTVIYKSSFWKPGVPDVDVDHWFPVASLQEQFEPNAWDDLLKESKERTKARTKDLLKLAKKYQSKK
jgi:hypothetical protein